MVNELLVRMGAFFTLIGIALILFFAITYFGNVPDFKFFFLGLISILIGRWFGRRKAPPHPSGRFATLRKMRGSSKQGKEEGKKE
ncbi:MAG: hypothetical protein WBW94_04970 [Anaerolineales bacterium]